MENEESNFLAYYREPGPLPRKACDHALFPAPLAIQKESGVQFARIDRYLFGLTAKGQDMFKCFLETPDELVAKYDWNKEVIEEIKAGEGWIGERLSFQDAMARMKRMADVVQNYSDGSVLFLFSRDKVDFNVEIYSTRGLDFIEGFIIASQDSHNYQDYFSVLINESNMVEIECDYGLNPPPDDNPWQVIYDGDKLSFCGHDLLPRQIKKRYWQEERNCQKS